MNVNDVSSMPIRVLCVFANLNRGGAETMLMNIYRNIDRDKVQFDFVKNSKQRDAYDDEILSLGGKIYNSPRYQVINHLKYVKWWDTFLANHEEYKIIHFHFFTIAPVVYKTIKKHGRVLIVHSHASREFHRGIKTVIKNFFEKQAEKCSDYRCACGNDAGKWLFPHRDFTVINNAVETEKFAYDENTRALVRKEIGVDGKFVVGTVGRITEQKNPMGILDIFNSVYRNDNNAVLIWCGDGPLTEQTKLSIKERGLESAVHMLGVRSDIDRIMQAIDVFILPSVMEGIPVVGVEAQCAGLPCVFSTGVPREVAITDNCSFISINDISKWEKDIISLKSFKRKNEAQQIIAAGYDVKSTAKLLEQFYSSIEKDNLVENEIN